MAVSFVAIMLIVDHAVGRCCSFVSCAIMGKICWIFLCGIRLFWESGGMNAVVLSVVVILHILVSGGFNYIGQRHTTDGSTFSASQVMNVILLCKCVVSFCYFCFRSD